MLRRADLFLEMKRHDEAIRLYEELTTTAKSSSIKARAEMRLRSIKKER